MLYPWKQLLSLIICRSCLSQYFACKCVLSVFVILNSSPSGKAQMVSCSAGGGFAAQIQPQLSAKMYR